MVPEALLCSRGLWAQMNSGKGLDHHGPKDLRNLSHSSPAEA